MRLNLNLCASTVALALPLVACGALPIMPGSNSSSPPTAHDPVARPTAGDSPASPPTASTSTPGSTAPTARASTPGGSPAMSPSDAAAQKKQFCAPYIADERMLRSPATVTYAQMSRPLDEAVMRSVVGDTLGCIEPNFDKDRRVSQADVAEWLDRGSDSELLRVAFVLKCVPRTSGNDHSPLYSTDSAAGAQALCLADARRLSIEALEREIAAPGYNDWARAKARQVFAEAKTVGERFAAEASKATNAEARRMISEVAPKAVSDWEQSYAANKAAIDAARAFEVQLFAELAKQSPGERGAPKALGCQAGLSGALARYVQSKQPKTADDVVAAANDVVGAVLLDAVIECDAMEGRYQDAMRGVELSAKGGRAFFRGPRYAVVYTLNMAARTSAHAPPGMSTMVTQASVARRMAETLIDQRSGTGQAVNHLHGVVKKMTPHALGQEVEFAKETIIVPDEECVNSRIVNYYPDGTPIWRATCHTVGHHPETVEQPNVVVTVPTAALLRPGYYVDVTWQQIPNTATTTGPLVGYPSGVWSNKAATTLVSYFGIPLH